MGTSFLTAKHKRHLGQKGWKEIKCEFCGTKLTIHRLCQTSKNMQMNPSVLASKLAFSCPKLIQKGLSKAGKIECECGKLYKNCSGLSKYEKCYL